ncbi:prepilin-type N-terminal cleavage/methylation domain-containing protein [Pseudomonas sp. UL073]|uniref:Prepilin-type N-terminal cleavage/methylation domain-containing protein n=1 Tax=Zestomonas insulae TaxID=2809017 RepID=A0ABS2IGP9_9GAMM|nr:prepilin-type N-terminal cleavage/methylation domain-containing protein [Pseudomonas insulae]MBM7061514.1 prepilin-type N-terminal cleavage/methylation domain-containing protein [Pseudomonas insulae]
MISRAQGFTLIELMLVVAVIGVLVGVAIPQFNEYRAKANDASAQSDARNAIGAFRIDKSY